MNAYEFFFSPVLFALLGLLIGSFLNVVIYRVPLMMERAWMHDFANQLREDVKLPPAITLALPGSACRSCGHKIRWYENVPVVSYLCLRGKCAGCSSKISLRYPLVEITTAVLFSLIAWKFGPLPVVLFWALFAAALIALAGIDWDTTLLPDDITLPLLWAGVMAAAMGWTVPLLDAVTGAAVGYLILWTVYWAFKLLTGKEGMGYGDFKLLAALGAGLGWQAIVPILIGAGMLGTIGGLWMKFQSELRDGKYVPFGPFLAVAGISVMFMKGTPLEKLCCSL